MEMVKDMNKMKCTQVGGVYQYILKVEKKNLFPTQTQILWKTLIFMKNLY